LSSGQLCALAKRVRTTLAVLTQDVREMTRTAARGVTRRTVA
jgi:hypothetical protein